MPETTTPEFELPPVVTVCMVGQEKPCGKPATHLIAVTVVADTAWSTEARQGGIVGLCEAHATTPVSQWENVDD